MPVQTPTEEVCKHKCSRGYWALPFHLLRIPLQGKPFKTCKTSRENHKRPPKGTATNDQADFGHQARTRGPVDAADKL